MEAECGDGEVEGWWNCYRCSYRNSEGCASCDICAAPRLGTNSPSPISSGKRPLAPSRFSVLNSMLPGGRWLCPFCTGENAKDSANCGSCGVKRSQWHCPKCTFKNSMEVGACEECGEPNPVRSMSSGQPEEQCSAGSGVGVSGDSATVDSSHRPSSVSRQQSEQVENVRKVDEMLAYETMSTIIAFCMENNQSFVDDSFPPAERSLGQFFEDDGISKEYIIWLRPQEIFTRDSVTYRWALFRDPLKPTDIQQGCLGDCWFLSALAVLAERPDRLRNIFLTQTYCHQGAYQVRLNIEGRWTVILVDDWFPCFARNKMMAFSEGRRNQLWVPVIEKALAKICGGYASLVAGRCIEGLAILTGAPCESVSMEDHRPGNLNDSSRFEESYGMDVIWVKLLSCREAKFLMGASCGAGRELADEAVYQAVGLYTRHAYSVLDVQEVNEIRLVKLRNPWGGNYNWRGAWSDGSSLWTREMRDYLMPEGPQEGVFWMPFEDFYSYFDTVDICKLRDGWREVRFSLPLPPHCLGSEFQLIRLIVTETTEVDLTLYQEGVRHQNNRKCGQLDLCIVVAKEGNIEGSFGEFVCWSGRRVRAFVGWSGLFQPGVYLVFCLSFNHWGMELMRDEVPNVVLAAHSAKPVVGEKFKAEPVLLADCIIATAMAKGKKQNMGDGGWYGAYHLIEGDRKAHV